MLAMIIEMNEVQYTSYPPMLSCLVLSIFCALWLSGEGRDREVFPRDKTGHLGLSLLKEKGGHATVTDQISVMKCVEAIATLNRCSREVCAIS